MCYRIFVILIISLSFLISCKKDNTTNPELSLKITTLSPSAGCIGGLITITGTGFGFSQGIVNFNGTVASVYSRWSDDVIEVNIPNGATSGKVSVIVNGLKSNEVDFIVHIFDTTIAINIFGQIWMKKNLDVDHYRNGDIIPEVKDSVAWSKLTTGAWCYYNNDPVLGAIYGKLYNWYAVNDPRGLAPTSWHVPSEGEWTELETNIHQYWGGYPEQVGGRMKETGTTHWKTPNEGANNVSGFTALPGGFRTFDAGFDTSHYSGIGEIGEWWSSTEWQPDRFYQAGAHYRVLDNTYSNIFNNGYGMDKRLGRSVRCVWDYR
ncbi:MAG: hypothetical protein EPN82_02540 [Bacteroidetes bacterium]|nr:MAG: hypothetical protein EPN82_02540 [Bacteroidota bacterium]